MKNKFIMLTVLLAVIVSMTGIAAARPYDVEWLNAAGTAPAPFPISLKPGDSITLSYKAYDIDPSSLPPNFGGLGELVPYYSSVIPLSGGALASHITVTTPVNVRLSADPTIDVGAITIALSSTARVGASYRVNVGAGSDVLPVTIENGKASRIVNSVPEFPAVALPVGAAIGLLFLFQRRKNKEE